MGQSRLGSVPSNVWVPSSVQVCFGFIAILDVHCGLLRKMIHLLVVGLLAATTLADVKHVLEGSAHPPNAQSVNQLPYWWMGNDSPLKVAYDHYKECSPKGTCAPAQPQPFSLKSNPFLNGAPQGGSASFNNAIDISKNPFLNGAVVSGNGEAVAKGQDGFLGVQPVQPFSKKGFATTHPLAPKPFEKQPIQGAECRGVGKVCVAVELCRNGVVLQGGEGFLQVRTGVEHCNEHQTCCQLSEKPDLHLPTLNEITAGKSSIPGGSIKFQGASGFSAGSIQVLPEGSDPKLYFSGSENSGVTNKATRDTSGSPVDYSNTNFDDVRFASTFQGPAYLPPVESSPSTQRPYQVPTYQPSTQRPYQLPSQPSSPRPVQVPTYQPSTQRPYQPSPQGPYQVPVVVGPQPIVTPRPVPSTPRDYLPPSSNSNVNNQYVPQSTPGPSSPRPFQPAPSTPRPYQPAQPSTPRPYQPAPSTPRPYQPSITPAQPNPSTARPTTSRDYLPPRQPQPSSPRPNPFSTPKPSVTNGYYPSPSSPQPSPYQPGPSSPQQPSRPTPAPYQPSPSSPQPRPTPAPYQPSQSSTNGYQYPSPSSPQPRPSSPQYQPSPSSPQPRPSLPQYQPSPSSPQPRPTSPPYQPSTNGYQYPSPSSPQPRPSSPQYQPSPSSPQYRPTSPPYQPSTNGYSPSSPQYQPSPSSPQYQPSPSSPQPRPTSPQYQPSTNGYQYPRPTSPQPAPYQPSPSSPHPRPTLPPYQPSQPSFPQPSTNGYQYPKPNSPQPRPTLPPYQPSPSSPQPRPTSPPYQPSQPSFPQPSTNGYQYPSPSSPQPRPTLPPYQPSPSSPQPRPTSPPYQPSQPSFPQPSTNGYQYPKPSSPQPRPTPAPYQPSPSSPQPRPTPPPYQPGPSSPQPSYPSPSSPQPRPTPPPYQPGPSSPQPSHPSTNGYQYPSPSSPQPNQYQPSSPRPNPFIPQQPNQPSTPFRPQPTRGPNPADGYVYPQPNPTFGYPSTSPRPSASNTVNNQYVPRPPPNGYLPPTSGPDGSGSTISNTNVPRPEQPDNTGDAANTNINIIRPTTQRSVFTGELNTAPPTTCAAALKCVQEIYCNADGTISPVPVVLTKDQEFSRVPTTECQDTESGIIGKCCRDLNYKDPWPSANLVNGVDDGQYKEDDGLGQYAPDLQRNVRSHQGGPRQDYTSTVNSGVPTAQPTCGERHPNSNPPGPGPFDVDFAEIPWQAMVLRDSNRSLLCGGAIIRRDAVLTAAHCVEGLETSDLLIKGGEWKLGIDEEPLPFQIVKVATVVRHPQYQRGSLVNDLAILVLEEKLRPAKNIGTICLPPANQIPTENCIATGWGKRILQLHAKGAIMHSIGVKIMDNQQCQDTLSAKFQGAVANYSPNTLCGYSNIDQCKVDYGSALACSSDNGRFTLSGIFAWDTGCKQEGQIGGYIAPDVEWIESSLSKTTKQLKQEEHAYLTQH